MNLLFLNQADQSGGAARASWRLTQGLRLLGESPRTLTRNKSSSDPTVTGPLSKSAKFLVPLRFHLGVALSRLQRSPDRAFRSLNLIPSRWAPTVNDDPADLVHAHFIGGETLSLADFSRIRKPLVWTLHDMWGFCGAEHVAPDGPDARWRVGYRSDNRPAGFTGPDLDAWTWRRKRRLWTRPLPLVTPSRWLADCVSASRLLGDWPVTVIPNGLDTRVFQPLPKAFCRQALGLPADRKIILFGALGGGSDPNKGFDLLASALHHWAAGGPAEGVLGVVFGQAEPAEPPALPLPVRWLGHLHDDASLALVYNAADVVVVPSRTESFGQTASEAQSCGVPVVAFRTSGLRDVVAHGETGHLAEPYEPASLAAGIEAVLGSSETAARLGRQARDRAVRLWDLPVVAQAHLDLYHRLLEEKDAHAKT